MASEPRNYPYYVFVAYDEDFSAQTYDIAVSLEPGNLVGKPVKYIRHDLNTLPDPAATDTGLEAVLLPGWPKLCEFSQAEELLAAERAEHDNTIATLTSLITDNAAKDERIKELDRCHEGTIDLCNQKTAQIKAIEAKLAASQEALEPFADHAKERAVDAPEWRDTDTVQIVVTIGDLRAARAALGGKPS